MNILHRNRNLNQSTCVDEPKRFERQKNQLGLQRLYSEGVQYIIKYRRLLQVQDDTVLMAIELFKGYIKRYGTLSANRLIPICIACLLICSKINEIYPPTIQQFTEAYDFIGKPQQITKIQALLLKRCDFQLPLTENLLSGIVALIELKTEDEKVVIIKKAFQVIYKFISDPFYFNIQNRLVAKALLVVISQKQNKGQTQANKYRYRQNQLISQKKQNKIKGTSLEKAKMDSLKSQNRHIATIVHHIRNKINIPRQIFQDIQNKSFC